MTITQQSGDHITLMRKYSYLGHKNDTFALSRYSKSVSYKMSTFLQVLLFLFVVCDLSCQYYLCKEKSKDKGSSNLCSPSLEQLLLT